jgi:hypothetical protein
MLKETIIKYRTEEYNLNCAEAIIYAVNGEYNLNLKEETLGYIKCVDLKKEYANVKRCTLRIEIDAEVLDNTILKEKHK